MLIKVHSSVSIEGIHQHSTMDAFSTHDQQRGDIMKHIVLNSN